MLRLSGQNTFNEDGLMDQSVAELMAKLKEDIIL
jgi:hypothetical protein